MHGHRVSSVEIEATATNRSLVAITLMSVIAFRFT
jgi:hypothetical protein